MKHIIKVNNIQEAKDNPIRPIIALDNNNVLFAEGQPAGPQIEFVDLGLASGTLWAKSLLGATNSDTVESWYGNYYAWGEIETKTDYSWSTYKYANGSSKRLTKYCDIASFGNNGFTDELTQLVAEDDAATTTNSAWRIPTEEELRELTALPNEWVTNYNGVTGLNGIVFTGTNGNTLFIPAAGYRDGSDISNAGSYCNLWSSSLYLGLPNCAYSLYFSSDYVTMISNNRCTGFSVCPVLY